MALVSVVGGGPAGLRCAALVAREGFEVNVLEEHPIIGRPVQCAGLISENGLRELNLGLNEDEFVVNRVYGARIFSPNGTMLEIRKEKPVALVIDRFKFDQLLCRQAQEAGASVKLGSKVIDFRNNSLFIETKGHGELMKSRIVVGADGPSSAIRHAIGRDVNNESFVHALQYRAKGTFDAKMVELHFGKYAKGFFGWVIPESETVARVGLAVKLGEDVEKGMRIFLQEKKIEANMLGKSSALIPISPPLRKIVENGVMLLGDAAFHTKAMTGGGLIMGLNAAAIAAESILSNLKHHAPLQDYETNLAGINKELSLHWRIYSYIHSLNENALDNLFIKAKKAGLESFLAQYGNMDRPSKFVRKMLLKPRLWGLAPAALRFIMG